jgi:uncharacterized membrane protein YccC
MHPLQWLSQRDRDFVAIRRAGRTAIIMPAMFALGDKVIANPEVAAFAAFGAFATLLLADFGGPMLGRIQAQLALVIVGGVFVCLGTLASQTAWLAAVSMAVVAFLVLFAGVVSSVLARATTALLLAFILPVSLAAPASAIPDRLAGWAMSGAVSVVAVALLWPAPAHDPLRRVVVAACRALAARLRADAAYVVSGRDPALRAERDEAAERSDDAVKALHRAFLGTPYRPTGLSTATRTLVRLVDEVNWVNAIAIQPVEHKDGGKLNQTACAVKSTAADVLDSGADLLVNGSDSAALHTLHAAQGELTGALTKVDNSVMSDLAVRRLPPGTGPDGAEPASEFITSLDPAFRAQELNFAASLIGRNIDLTAAAERRSWPKRLLGRQPEGVPGTLSAAQERAAAHVDWHSVWLHNSVRGAVGLGLAVLVARLTDVEHAFWVVLGALSVLRSNALNTGYDVVRAMLGTVAGFIIGAALLLGIGTNLTILWVLLPLAIFLAGIAPAVISFAGGQAAFTLVLVILFNIIQPAGWRVGLLRVEDIALGCAVSLVVGVLFWPRGAGAALSRALADAYTDSADYLASAVNFGMRRCDGSKQVPDAPADDSIRAAAAARRLDDAFRTYLAERGSKPLPLADVTRLVTGVVGIRLAGDAVLDLWVRDDCQSDGDRAAARSEILEATERVRRWYIDLADSLVTGDRVPEPQPHDEVADGRLVETVRHDLSGADGKASETAVRVIWTADHLDAARRLQTALIGAATAAVKQRARGSGARSFLPRLARASELLGSRQPHRVPVNHIW